jgi:hypothetical protein
MGPEEMRMELERFVNVGLQEGWSGWPLKVESCISGRFGGQWATASVQPWLGGSDRVVRSDGMGAYACLHTLC